MANQKRVIITGAGGGIGSCLTQLYAREGAHLILCDVRSESLEDVAAQAAYYGATVESYIFNISNKAEVESFAQKVLASGPVDILINNAGVGHNGEMLETTDADWDKLWNVNFHGPLNLVEAFRHDMQRRGAGQIVNVSSGQAWYRLPTWQAYATVKLALGAYSESLYYELLPHDVYVTTVYPYMVNTGFYNGIEGDTFAGKMAMKLVPLYSDSPETVARRIYHAVKARKRVEMVNPINRLGIALRASGMMDPVTRLASIFLLKEGRNPDTIKSLLTGGLLPGGDSQGLGFSMDEIMSGHHEFMPGCGEAGQKGMHFKVHWGTDNLAHWMNPTKAEFMNNNLSGTITIEGLGEDIPCHGRLEMKYFTEQKIRYVLYFSHKGHDYEYIGEKRNILPWNLPTSHTTCYGDLYDKTDGNRIVSKSITYFRWETLPAFLQSLRFGKGVQSTLQAGQSTAPVDLSAASA